MLKRTETKQRLVERRYNGRFKSTTLVFARSKNAHALGHLVNLSIDGSLIHVEGINPSKHERLLIVIAVRLNNGRLVKLNFRDATVIHITDGNIGVSMGRRDKPLIK